MISRLLARLEELEAAMTPKGRHLCFLFVDEEGLDRETQLAAFKAEHGVTPIDELIEVTISYV